MAAWLIARQALTDEAHRKRVSIDAAVVRVISTPPERARGKGLMPWVWTVLAAA
jgi:hypothetical protein